MKLVLGAVSIVLAVGLLHAADVTPVYSDEGATATLTVPAGVTNGLSVVFADTVTKIIKDGPGALKLTVNQNASLKANWDIQAGRVIADMKAYFGTSATVTVGVNGTLDSIVSSTPRIGVTLAGTLDASRSGGIGGKFDPIYLSGDAATIVYGKDKAWGIYQTSLYMYGLPVTIKGPQPSSSCNVGLRLAGDSSASAMVYDVGNMVVDGSNLWLGNEPITFANTAGHEEQPADADVVLRNGGYLSFNNKPASRPFPMGVRSKGSTQNSVVIWAGSSAVGAQSDGANTLSGPVSIDKGSTLRVWARSGFQTTWTGPIDAEGKLYKTGQGLLWVTGTVARAVNELSVDRGLLKLDHAGLFEVTGTADTYVGYDDNFGKNYDGIPAIVVGDGSVFCKTGGAVRVASKEKNNYYNGILEILPGGCVTNCLTVGRYGNGTVRQFGGNLHWLRASDSQGLGYDETGYGVYLITNGEMRCAKDTCFSMGRSGTALYYQTGGNSYPDYSMYLGQYGGQADIYVSAGTFYDKNSMYAGSNVKGDSTRLDGHATVTVDGPTVDFYANFLSLQAKGGHFTTQVNVRKGGVFRPTYLCRTTAAASYPDLHYYLTADGGTYKRSGTGDWHKSATDPVHAGWLPADKLVVYKGGVTFDVATSNRWSTPIVAPTGKGVKSITLPKAVLDFKRYPGPAKLTIASGAGAGATAVCDYEPIERTFYTDMGRQKGVIVTCPGWDYTDAGGVLSVTCTVYHANVAATNYQATIELEENDRSGGLVKIGSGQLVIASQGNTYEGETCVSNGTLIVEAGASLPACSTIRLCSASLAFRDSGTVVSNMVVDGHAWISGSGIKVANSLTVDAKLLNQDRYLQIPGGIELLAGAKLVLRNAADLKERKIAVTTANGRVAGVQGIRVEDENGNELTNVRASLSSDQKALRFGPTKGLMLIVR